jgi:hypothetical protein
MVIKTIIDTYKVNPEELRNLVKSVSETPSSIARRRLDFSLRVVLAESTNPSYWVYSEEKNLLMPKPDYKLHGAGFNTLLGLFEVQGIQSTRFNLLKPALVNQINKEWELAEKGLIQFC